VSKVAKEIQRWMVGLQDEERRIQAARSFFQDGNLELALTAAKMASTVAVENQSLEFDDPLSTARVRLGLGGLFVVDH
jgi:hypothetical protein